MTDLWDMQQKHNQILKTVYRRNLVCIHMIYMHKAIYTFIDNVNTELYNPLKIKNIGSTTTPSSNLVFQPLNGNALYANHY